MTRTPPPGLPIEIPPCPLCWRTVDCTVDGFECPDCEVHWSYEDQEAPGEWFEPEREQCQATMRPLSAYERSVRCVLAQGHNGEHRTEDVITWRTEEVAA